MKITVKVIALLIASFMCLGLFACNKTPDIQEDDGKILSFYVVSDAAKGGNGSEDSPFSTLDEARDAIRAADRSLFEGINVYVSGRFYMTEPFYLNTEADSGSENCPISWIGLDNAELTGGITIKPEEFEPVEGELKNYFPEESRNHIVQIDLKKYGLTSEDFEHNDLTSKGYNYSKLHMVSPFCGNTRLTPARYPDDDFSVISGYTAVEGGSYFEITEEDAAHVRNWHYKDDIYVKGNFTLYWAADVSKVLSFDENGASMTVQECDGYTPVDGMTYYWYNIPEELNLPGEYYLNPDGMLYWYPITDTRTGSEDLIFPVAKKELLHANGVNFVTFKNISFTDSQYRAVVLYGNNNIFDSCSVMRTGGINAMELKGFDNLVINSEFAYMAYAGLRVDGGDTNTLTPSNNLIKNNYFHHFSESKSTYCGGLSLYGVGVTVSQNEFAYSNHLAIGYDGNNHLIELNEFHDICTFTDDAGVIYCGRSLSLYGTVIRYNYFHEIGSGKMMELGGNGCHCIYWDDHLGGQTAIGNIFENVDGNGINASGGPDCIIKNNIGINCSISCACDFAVKYVQIFEYKTETGDLLTAAQKKANENPAFAAAFPTLLQMNDIKDIDNEWYWVLPARIVFTDNANFCRLDKQSFSYKTIWDEEYSEMGCAPVERYSTVENNKIFIISNNYPPTPQEAIAEAGYDIPFDDIGRQRY